MYACNGILFNHESPRRGEMFVTRKIPVRLLISARDLKSASTWVTSMQSVTGVMQKTMFVCSG